jgi:hypothetical protein
MTYPEMALMAVLMGILIVLIAIIFRKIWNGLVNGEFEEFEDVDELPTLDPYDIAMTIKKDARLSTQYELENMTIKIEVGINHKRVYYLEQFYAVDEREKPVTLPKGLAEEVEQYFEWDWFE